MKAAGSTHHGDSVDLPGNSSGPPTARTGRRIGCGLFLAFLLAFSYGFRSPIHYSDPIHLKVIDEETGKPLADVAAIAVWWLDTMGLSIKLYKAEAVSDADGDLYFAGLPPRIRPPLTWFKYFDPMVYLYKPGHSTALLHNGPYAEPVHDAYDTLAAKRLFFWNGHTIPLDRDRAPEQYLESFRAASAMPERSDMRPSHYPKFWQALAVGYKRLTPAQKERESDPQQIIDYWTKRDGK